MSASATSSASAGFACGTLVADVNDLASTVTASDKTKQEKADAVRNFGSQISADAKTAKGALMEKLNSLSMDVSALAADLTSGAGVDQVKQDLSKVTSNATGAAKACITQ
jgi:hypothetical protein